MKKIEIPNYDTLELAHVELHTFDKGFKKLLDISKVNITVHK